MTTRLTPTDRQKQILDAALDQAQQLGFSRFTRRDVAQAVGVAGPLVTHYCGTMDQLREEVMRMAIRGKVLSVIAEGIVARDPIARKAPKKLRDEALETLK